MYARAREHAGDVWADRAVAVAMTATAETARAVRVKYDALRWYASKLAPKTYADRHTVEANVTATTTQWVIRGPTPVSSTEEWLRLHAPKDIEAGQPILDGEAEAQAPDASSPPPPVEATTATPNSTVADWLAQHRPRGDYGH